MVGETESLVEAVQEAITKHGHYHHLTVTAHQQLSHHLLALIARSDADGVELVGVLWKWCQYGPFDSRRRLISNSVSGPITSTSTSKSTSIHGEVVRAIWEAVGVQVALMTAVGGRLHDDLLKSLNLPVNPKNRENTRNTRKNNVNSQELFAINAVHLGDLFRYLHQYTGDDKERVAYKQTAIKCYQRVISVVPECGLAWNQLGVMTSDGNLKAVYFYVKALQAKQPFLQATNNIKSLLKKVDLHREPDVLRMAADFFVLHQRVPLDAVQMGLLGFEEQTIFDYLLSNQ